MTDDYNSNNKWSFGNAEYILLCYGFKNMLKIWYALNEYDFFDEDELLDFNNYDY